MIKCACENKDCVQKIYTDSETGTISVECHDGKTVVIYLDANETVKLINELKKLLLGKLEHGEY